MFKELLSQQNELVGGTVNPRNRNDDGKNKTRNNNGVKCGNKRMRDKGSNSTGIVVNARGMDDRTKRGLLVEMIVLKGSPLGFLKMTNVCAGELQDMSKFR